MIRCTWMVRGSWVSYGLCVRVRVRVSPLCRLPPHILSSLRVCEWCISINVPNNFYCSILLLAPTSTGIWYIYGRKEAHSRYLTYYSDRVWISASRGVAFTEEDHWIISNEQLWAGRPSTCMVQTPPSLLSFQMLQERSMFIGCHRCWRVVQMGDCLICYHKLYELESNLATIEKTKLSPAFRYRPKPPTPSDIKPVQYCSMMPLRNLYQQLAHQWP